MKWKIENTYNILQWGCPEHLEDGVGLGGGDAQHDGLLTHACGVLIQRGPQFPGEIVRHSHPSRYYTLHHSV